MDKEIKESDYIIGAAIVTVIYFVLAYCIVCIVLYIFGTGFDTGFDFIKATIIWLIINSFYHVRDTYRQTKAEMKEHVEKNGGIL